MSTLVLIHYKCETKAEEVRVASPLVMAVRL
jgi:hypothetical protein